VSITQTTVKIRDTITDFLNNVQKIGQAYVNDLVKGWTGIFQIITGFVQGLFTGKNSIANSFISIFNTIKSIAMPILSDIVNFIGSEFAQIKKWWDTYGGQITEAVKNFFAVLAVIFKALAPVLEFIIKSVWDNIKGVIDGAIKIIEGIILVFTGIFTGNWSTLWQGIKDILGGAVEAIWNIIQLMFIGKLLKGIGGFFGLLKELFSGGWTSIVNGLKLFVDDAGTWFAKFLDTASTNFNKIVDAAKNIPSGIVAGLKSGVGAIEDAIGGLATTLVDKFKSALGIHSPSKVFTEMGGHILDGLVNGLSSGNLLDLGKAVFKDFGGGIMNTVDKIKGFLTGAFSGGSGGNAAGWIQSALSIVGAPSSWLGPLSTLVQHESGGDPNAINLWDSNAKAGHPSKGLFQTIDSTFNAYAIKGLGDIYNPVANAVAGIRYIMSRYGDVFNVPGIKSMMSGGAYKGYATGTNSAVAGWHMVGEEGPELMYVPGGSVIKNNRDTNKMLGGTNKTYNVTVNSLQASMDEKDLVRALQRMEALNYA
jgi:SLT domain-containing protein